MTALDLAADVGLLAVFLAATNICVGLLIAVRYSPRRWWPHRRVNIFAVHTWTAYFLMTSLLVHPIILLFSRKIRWRLWAWWFQSGLQSNRSRTRSVQSACT